MQSPCVDDFCSQPVRAAVPVYRVGLSDAPLESTGRYALDLEKALLLRRVTLDSGLMIEERWYAHLVQRQLLVHEITINNIGGAAQELGVLASVGEPSADINFTATTTAGSRSIFGRVNVAERPELPPATVAVCSNVPPATSRLTVAASECKTYRFISAVATSLDSAEPQQSAATALSQALAMKDGQLLQQHEYAWLQRWEQGRIEIGGNLGLAQAVNASLYYLLSSIRADWPQGMSPGGLASNGCA